MILVFGTMEYRGSTVIGEKGQVVVPAETRERFGIKPGDKFLVLTGEKMGAWGIILVKADVVSKVVEKMLGGSLEDLLANNKGKRKGKAK